MKNVCGHHDVPRAATSDEASSSATTTSSQGVTVQRVSPGVPLPDDDDAQAVKMSFIMSDVSVSVFIVTAARRSVST